MNTRKILGLLGLALTSCSGAWASTITLVSGNGSVGGADSAITFLLGPATGDFGAAFTGGNFTSAQTGPAARIVAPNAVWLAAIPGALWISDNVNGATTSGNTDLYAIAFNIPVGFTSADFTITYAVDNKLGTTQLPLYLNGSALGLATNTGFLGTTSNYSQMGVGSLLHTGVNWLYIDATNTGGPAGLLFSATITTVDDTGGVPEPSTLVTLGLGLVAFSGLRRFRKARS